MQDTITLVLPEGHVDIIVQTRDNEAHSRLSSRLEDWQMARTGIQLLVSGVLVAPKGHK